MRMAVLGMGLLALGAGPEAAYAAEHGTGHTGHTEHRPAQPSAAPPASPGTQVCGTLRLAEEWTIKGSPYLVTGDIFVPVTSRLRIEAGVEVRVASRPKPCPEASHGKAAAHTANAAHGELKAPESPAGHGKSSHAGAPETAGSSAHGAKAPAPGAAKERDLLEPPAPRDFSDSAYTTLTLEGAFYCIGTAEKPVRFLPADTTPGSPPWDGIRLSGQREGRAEIAFTEFRGANAALVIEKADLFIHHSVFVDNNTGMRCGLRADVTPLFNVFARNRSTGLIIEKSAPHLVNNIFWENRGYGIWSDGGKSMIIEYNAFFGNGEEDCYRCPHDILPIGDAGSGDTVDSRGNRRADPVFIDSESFKALRLKDPRHATPDHLVKDTAIAAAEKKTRWRWFKSKSEAQVFTPRGRGPYRLSEYSPLVKAGHPGGTLRNGDGSRSDMGIWGGPLERITKNPFLGY